MSLSLKERRVLSFCRESNIVVEQMSVVKKKPKRVSDFLEDPHEMNTTKASFSSSSSSSSPPPSPRFLSRWFSSLRDIQLLRITLNVCSGFEQDSKGLVHKGKRNRDVGSVENGADIDGEEDGSQKFRDAKNSVVSHAQVAPNNNVGSDSDLPEAGGRRRKFCKKNKFMRSLRKSASQSHMGSSDAKEKGELLASSDHDLFAAQTIPLDSKVSSIDSTAPGSDSYLKASSSPNLPIPCSKQSEMVTSSGNYLGEVSFNFGVGVGLACLIAKSKNELDKMAELRCQMEMLLKEIRNEIQKKDIVSNLSMTNNNTVCSSSDSQGLQRKNLCNAWGNHTLADNLVEAHSAVESDHLSNSVATSMSTFTSNSTIPAFESAQCQGMDQLEAELEAELERLELNLDMENSSKIENSQKLEMILADTALDKSLTASLRIENDHGEEKYGISPHKLERRLHELLETRQEERISELESALEQAGRMLLEKEMEINWWKYKTQFDPQNPL